MELKEWIIEFMKNKDLLQKKIVEIKNLDKSVEIQYKDKRHIFFIQKEVNFTEIADVLEQSNKDNTLHVSIVCPNKRSNLNTLLEHWNRIKDFVRFSMYFVNVSSQTEKKWVIHPRVHHKISDPASLKLGLETMFTTVQEMT